MPIPNYSRYLYGRRTQVITQPDGSTSINTSEVVNGLITRSSTVNKTPNWYKVRKTTPLPNNDYYVRSTERNDSIGSVVSIRTVHPKSISKTSGCIGTTTSAAAVTSNATSNIFNDIASTDRNAIITLRNKMKDMRVNLGNFIAERDRTVALVADTAKSMAAAIVALKKADYVGASKHLGLTASRKSRRVKGFKRAFKNHETQAIANAWLSLGYGWLPLISDVQGMAESLSKLTNKFAVDKIQHSVTRTSNEVVSTKLTDGWSGYNIEERQTTFTIRYVIFYEVNMNGSQSLAGLGITNPASIAWEMMPWSFVIDWFIPIGNWIASLDAELGTTFRTGSRALKTEISNKATRDASLTSANSVTSAYAMASYKEKTYSRSRLSATPIAYFPGFKDPRSAEHWANAAALLAQAANKVTGWRKIDTRI